MANANFSLGSNYFRHVGLGMYEVENDNAYAEDGLYFTRKGTLKDWLNQLSIGANFQYRENQELHDVEKVGAKEYTSRCASDQGDTTWSTDVAVDTLMKKMIFDLW